LWHHVGVSLGKYTSLVLPIPFLEQVIAGYTMAYSFSKGTTNYLMASSEDLCFAISILAVYRSSDDMVFRCQNKLTSEI